jgi:hypothetical protein
MVHLFRTSHLARRRKHTAWATSYLRLAKGHRCAFCVNRIPNWNQLMDCRSDKSNPRGQLWGQSSFSTSSSRRYIKGLRAAFNSPRPILHSSPRSGERAKDALSSLGVGGPPHARMAALRRASAGMPQKMRLTLPAVKWVYLIQSLSTPEQRYVGVTIWTR